MTCKYRLVFMVVPAFLVFLAVITYSQNMDENGTEQKSTTNEDLSVDADEEILAIEEPVVEDIELEELPLEEVVEEPLEEAVAGEPEGEVAEEPEEKPLGEVAEEPVKELVEEPVAEAEEEVAEEVVEEAVVEELEEEVGEEVKEEIVEEALEEPAEEPVEEAAEEVKKEPEEEPLEEIVEEPVAELVEEPVAEAVEEVAEEVVEETVVEELEEEVAEEVVEEAVVEELEEEVGEEVKEEIVEEALEEVGEEVVKEPVEEPVEEPLKEVVWEPAPLEKAEVKEEKEEVPAAPEEAFGRIEEEAFADAIAEGVPEAPPIEAEIVPEGIPTVPEEKVKVDLRAASIAEAVAQEAQKRLAFKEHAITTLKAAQEELNERRYEAAAALFQEALKYLPRPETDHERLLAKRGLAESYYCRAISLEKQWEFKAALGAAKHAVLYGHPKGDKLVVRIRDLIEHPPAPKPAPTPPRWEEEEYRDKEGRVAALLKKGREHFMAGEYDEAQKNYESVLSLNPHNTEAIRLMQKVAQKKYDRATVELEATREDMISEVRKAWNPREYASIERPGAAAMKGVIKKRPEAESIRIKMLKKMEQIVVPEIDFRQANIHDVVTFLQEASVEFDPTDVPKEKKGVNIILNLKPGGRAVRPGPVEPVDIFAEPGVTEVGGGEEVPLITFSARYLSLLEALRIVTEVANLKYRVTGSVVMIIPIDAAEGDIIVRMYDVLPSVEERIPAMGAELGAAPKAVGDFIPMEAAGVGGEATDWKNFFAQMGVKWPEGSSIKYVRSIGKIVVANTENNLTDFEKILAELNVVPNQIEIEARFVEISQADVSSLGLEWLLTDEWEIAQKKSSQGLPLTSRERIVMKANATAGGFTKGNRFLTQAAGGTAIADDILGIASVLTNPELEIILHLLERSGHADMLSAPKVTTQAGQEATIKVVTEYIYPTDFSVTGIAGAAEGQGEAGIVGAVVEPSAFETREVGVIFAVLPDVSPEGQMINLTMMPEVVSEPEWKNYGSTYTDSAGNIQQLMMEQPFFHSRTISTSISIYNGATVVMGGMISEKRIDVNDKIPFLGDIPVIGRLFRSKYETSEKRNLLIFVTARLVDPAGRPIEKIGERIAGEFVEAAVPPATRTTK